MWHYALISHILYLPILKFLLHIILKEIVTRDILKEIVTRDRSMVSMSMHNLFIRPVFGSGIIPIVYCHSHYDDFR